MIILIILGIIIGVLVGFPVSSFLIKRHKRKIADDSVEKILKQKEANFQTSEGKPVSLNFKNDGKEVDLKKQVKEESEKTMIKEFNEIEKGRKIVMKKMEKLKKDKKKKEVKKKKVKK